MEPLSQSKSKLFASLLHKKYRYKHRLFIAEGAKCVQEAIRSEVNASGLVVREGTELSVTPPSGLPVYQASAEQFFKLTDQPHPEGMIAILEIPEFKTSLPEDQPAILLDSLQDPGNVGAILRVADWFGIRKILIGQGTVDLYHPKVVRSSMGSLFRMRLQKVDQLSEFVETHTGRLAIADLKGESLLLHSPLPNGILVIGNEANGVSEVFRQTPGIQKIRIPGGESTESLNAAVAAGIMIWEWRKG